MPRIVPFAVRPADRSDVPSLSRLRYEFRARLGGVVEDEPAFAARFESWLAARLDEPTRWAGWVACEQTALIGTVWIGLIEKMPNPVGEPEEHGYLTNFYVDPRRRGQGVGTALMTAALGWCEARGVHAVILWPTTRSRALYERHGFAPPAAIMERVVTRGHDPGRDDLARQPAATPPFFDNDR
jgi:GNAT superfamily N-acetyltransferase